jgi:hypothetical protein
MIRKRFVICAVFIAALGLSRPALAQSSWEFGYQPAHIPDNTVPMGFAIGLVGHLTPTWAIVGEVAAAKESDEVPGFQSEFTNMDIGGGVRWVPRTTWPVQPFVQVLTGAVRRGFDIDVGDVDSDDEEDSDVDDGADQTETDFMIQPGAGISLRLTGLWSAVAAIKLTETLTQDEFDLGDEYRLFFGARLDF